MSVITWQLEIYEGGDVLGARLGARVAMDGFGGEAVEGATEGAGPGPLILLAEGVVVGPAVIAPGKEVAVGSVRRRVAALVLGSERRQRHSPRKPRRLHRVGIHREPGHRSPHRH